ncbi:hypothetical protein [Flavobacterium sp. LB2R40]|uniref:hypothetical protein n=1 Tax=Flavobacterium sp. LB2R40 TaxID=3401722 RepID=UPI003AAAC1DA
MKKIITISFLFVFLCANTEIGQLLKLPNLIQHFSNHQEDTSGQYISLLDFLVIHYNDSEHHSNQGKDNHQSLPFKTINPSVNTVLTFENITQFSFRKPNTISVNSTVSFSQDFYISSVFASIWLPPKLS